MRTQTLGAHGPTVPVICCGCMTLARGITDTDTARQSAARTVEAALALGLNHFDHADIYQGGRAESLFGDWLAEHPSLRERLVIQSKCGIRPPDDSASCTRYDFSRAHIEAAVDGSLRRLRCEYLDVLLLHRPDALVDIEELAVTVDDLVSSGKIRHIGVSNHSAAQMRLLASVLPVPLIANQMEFNPVHNALVDYGLRVNRPDNPSAADGCDALEECRLGSVTIQAWSPLARGFLSGRPATEALTDARSQAKFPLDRILQTAHAINSLARTHAVPREAVVLAWILRHPAAIQPVIGTCDPARLDACAKAVDVCLSRDQWYTVLTAGRGESIP